MINATQFQIDSFRKLGEYFFSSLIAEMRALDIDVKPQMADHLCFRVFTAQEYDQYKIELLKHSQLLTEAMVKGRPICTFKMNKPFKYEGHSIDLLELPYPKENSEYKTGFEHAEFVLSESFEKFEARHPSVKFKIAGNKNLNPELCFKTQIGGVKFHYSPLSRVIEVEEATIKHVFHNIEEMQGFDWKNALPNSYVLVSHEPAQLKAAKSIKAIAAAKLWVKPYDLDQLITSGADVFFYNETELNDWLSKQN